MNENDFTIINGVLLEYTGEDTEVYVPDGTKEIGISAFEYADIKKVTVPESVKIIEWDAFSGCEELETVVLPDGIEEIEERAFDGCESLCYTEYCGCRYLGSDSNPHLALAECDSKDITEINIHKDTKLILARALEGCEKLASLTLPEGVRYIGTAAFQGCTSIESVTFPAGFKILESSAFAFCEKLTSVFFHYGVEKICRSAFSCASVCKLSVPETVRHVGWGAFSHYTCIEHTCYGGGFYYGSAENPYTLLAGAEENIESIELHKDTKIILDRVFFDNKKLKNVTLPAGLRHIGEDAFRQCEALETIELPESLLEIGEDAFASCKSLCKITMPKGEFTLGSGVFMGCEALTAIELPACNVQSYTFSGCTALEKVSLAKGAGYVDEYAFSDCPNMRKLTLAKGTRLDGEAFDEIGEVEIEYI